MNYCRRCESDYDKPGTCNCYAPATVSIPFVQVLPLKPLPDSVMTTGGTASYDGPSLVYYNMDAKGVMRDHNGNEIQSSYTGMVNA